MLAKSISFLILMSTLYFVIAFGALSLILDLDSGIGKPELALLFIIVSARFVLAGINSMLEGMGYRRYVTKVRITTALVNGSILCGCLYVGKGLSSIVISYTFSVVLLLLLHWKIYGSQIRELFFHGLRNRHLFSWRESLCCQCSLS